MKKIIEIEGMQCMHCAQKVKSAILNIQDVKSVKVNLNKKEAIIKMNRPIENQKLKEKIEEFGYEVKNIKEV